MLAKRRSQLCAALIALFLLLCVPSRRARADDTASYESQRLTAYLQHAGLRVADSPEHARIAYVRIVSREVFEGDDLQVPIVLPQFASTWPNAFHWRTEDSTIEREVLLHEGEPFSGRLADESMRNLRDLEIFSLVRIVAVQTSEPNQVGVLVYTRDLWSLRLEQEFHGVGSTFTLGAQLIERNFLGRDKSLAARVFIDPLTFSVGETYGDPRIGGGELGLYQAFDVVLNRASGHSEGSVGTLLFGKQFYNIAQRTGYDVLLHYADVVSRSISNGQVVGFDASPGPKHGDSCVPDGGSCIPRVWHDQRVKLEAEVHERFGVRYTQTFSFGGGFKDRAVAANAETGLSAAQQNVFDNEVLPRVRREVYPFVRYRLDLPTYAVFTNLGTFGQSESVQTGPRLDGRLALPLGAYGSSSDGFVVKGLAGYVWAEHDTLIDFVASGTSRLDGDSVVDQEGRLRLRAATPSYRWLWGRMVLRGVWDARQHDTQRTLVALGGDNGLRGYVSQAFYGVGASYLLGNVEYRTNPFLLSSIHVGAAAFYDAGSVYGRLGDARLHHDVGVGLRVLFPQFNRYVFRVDCGAPLDRGGFTVSFSYGSDQAIALTPGEDALTASAVDVD